MELIAPADWSLGPKEVDDIILRAATIGEFVTTGSGLTATCEVCLHSAPLDLLDLAAHLGADHDCSQVALRPVLQCSVCKSTEAVLQVTGQGRPVQRLTPAAKAPAYV